MIEQIVSDYMLSNPLAVNLMPKPFEMLNLGSSFDMFG